MLLSTVTFCLGATKSVQLKMEVNVFDDGRSSNQCNISYGTNDGSLSGSAMIMASFPKKGSFILFSNIDLTSSDDFKKGFPDIKEESIGWANPENVLSVFVKAGYVVTSVSSKSKREQFSTKTIYEYYLSKETP